MLGKEVNNIDLFGVFMKLVGHVCQQPAANISKAMSAGNLLSGLCGCLKILFEKVKIFHFKL
ncbi:hypothetical protein AALB39_25790 [Lachnospiraceae bacterium 54-53]